jgi:phosphopantetheine--protein transferase-like protein
MQIYTGIDIVELDRFRSLPQFERVAEFILSPRELRLMNSSRDRCQFLASRFALKEAVIKALPESASLADLEVLTTDLRPHINFQKKSLKQYAVAASLSHSENIVAASAIVFFK